ncbi:MAG: PEP-CTERM sorting domain-containing protein [Deltaproteobacteria bacterium]|nr:PEP-CTERM sorting domain-containing protein [Deltaproteobacteria bacterium]MBW2389910.1 PEP-CTERM sorting domain-containing protein [Deltaproteobacteria bacterium]MBW2726373.1 PEP-CTERM sorting domain-containing protein [Deltaproteobacteria bacterium]
MKMLRIFTCAVSAIWWLSAAGSSLAAPIQLGAYDAGDIEAHANPRLAVLPDVSAGGASLARSSVAGEVSPARSAWGFGSLERSDDWVLEILGVSALPHQGVEILDWSFDGSYVPEPGTAVLLALGLFGLAALSGRKFSAAAEKTASSAQ